jgi:hypothetical protein
VGFCGHGVVTLCLCDLATPCLAHLVLRTESKQETGEKRLIIFLSWVVLCCLGMQNFNYYFNAEWLQIVIAKTDLIACLHKVQQRLLLLHFPTEQLMKVALLR